MTQTYVGSQSVQCGSVNIRSRRRNPCPCPCTCAVLIRTEPVWIACSFMLAPRLIARCPAGRNGPCDRHWSDGRPSLLAPQSLPASPSLQKPATAHLVLRTHSELEPRHAADGQIDSERR